MQERRFVRTQPINAWVAMLHSTYGHTQNYNKTPFEVLSHLTEVSSLLAKFLIRKPDYVTARRFLPKMFAWAVALLKAVRSEETSLDRIILQKFPGVCAYCMKKPCGCWSADKPTQNPEKLRQLYLDNAASQDRSIGALELLFSEIYEESWRLREPDATSRVYLRLVEELAELAEATRFCHLYPKNFENELADFFAWWFALAVVLRKGDPAGITTEEMLWAAYPAQCVDCSSMPCFCPPGPVRELMSKPAPGQFDRLDVLTSLHNQSAFNVELDEIAEKALAVAIPIVCVRIDVDDFKTVNDTYGHSAGDEALKHIAAALRKKGRLRDRFYRAGGDEFGAILIDCSEEEGFGLMRRVSDALKATAVRWVAPDGKAEEFFVTCSIGIAECNKAEDIKLAFEKADRAAYASKQRGKKTITKASALQA